MAFWRRLLGRHAAKEEKPDTRLEKMVDERLESFTRGLYLQHKAALLAEWDDLAHPGAASQPLTDTQQEILRKTGPLPAQIISSLGISGLTEPQARALAHVIRSFVHARLACMVEAGRSQERERKRSKDPKGFALNDMEPMGNA